jgi:hypothetical protein
MAVTINGTTGLSTATGDVTAVTFYGNGANLTGVAAFASGTRLGFQQTSAPTGWTKDTTAGLNDSIMRIVTGSASSGGSTAFSTFNGQSSVGATTLATTQIPSHNHTVNTITGSGTALASSGVSNRYQNTTTGNSGGGGSHTHSVTTSIKYYDFIIASKD